jgi:hypothetical protein
MLLTESTTPLSRGSWRPDEGLSRTERVTAVSRRLDRARPADFADDVSKGRILLHGPRPGRREGWGESAWTVRIEPGEGGEGGVLEPLDTRCRKR